MGYAVPTTLISPSQIADSPFAITEPGLYILTDDVEYGTNSGTAITIDTNDVTLDLNNKSLINVASSATGIEISNTFTNITIKSGSIRGFDTAGINIPAGSTVLFFEDLTLIGSNAGLGLLFNGTSGSNLRTTGIVIRNCFFSHYLDCISATATDALRLDNTQLNQSRRGISAIDCNLWNLDNVQSSLHFISSVNRSIDAFSCNCWTIRNSEFNGNQSTSISDAVRFSILVGPGVSGGHIIENCMFCDNQSNNTLNVLSLDATHSCVIKNCSFDGNRAGTVLGGLVTTGSQHHIEGCSVSGNIGPNGLNGFLLGTSSRSCRLKNCYANRNVSNRTCNAFRPDGQSHIVENCVALNNVSLLGGTLVGRGFILNSGSGTLVKNCIAAGNSERGFDVGAGTYLFIGNTSFGHGASNYLGGIPFLTVATTGPYPLAGSFDNRNLANLSFN
jgi:hypothetical protein